MDLCIIGARAKNSLKQIVKNNMILWANITRFQLPNISNERRMLIRIPQELPINNSTLEASDDFVAWVQEHTQDSPTHESGGCPDGLLSAC